MTESTSIAPLSFQEKTIIETELIKRYCTTNKESIEWMKENAVDFQEIITDPEIIKTIRENKETAIQKIHEELAKRKKK